MIRTTYGGVLVALVAALLAVVGSTIGIATLWPVLLAAAIGLAPTTGSTLGRVGSFVIGSILGAVVFALQAGVLPATTSAELLLVVLGVTLVTVVGIVSIGRLPMWAGLAGLAAFNGLYGPVYADRPTAFLTEAPVVLLTLLLATSIGGAAAMIVEVLPGGAAEHARPDPAAIDPAPITFDDGEVA